jgi:threonine/homoserine/homoserine lactone efflux protein
VLLAESVSGGVARGFRAQAGANLTFAVLLAFLALGLSLAAPTGLALAALQAAGGALLLWLAADGLRPAAGPPAPHGRPAHDRPPVLHGRPAHDGSRETAGRPQIAPGRGDARGRRPGLPPAARGVLAVLLNPGSWLFLGAIAAPLFAVASQRDGTGGALLVAVVTATGCGCGDTAVVLIGGLGVRRLSDAAQQWVRRALALVLAGLGTWFLAAGMIPLVHI